MSPHAPRPVVIRCADGTALHGSAFDPAPESCRKTTAVVCSAMLVRHGFYAPFAGWMAARGYRVLTYDNRGVGTSLAAQGPGTAPRLREWGEIDLPAVLDHAERTAPGDRLVVVGHSMGGQLVALSGAVHRAEALVTVAATAAWWGHWPFPFNAGILGWYMAAPLLGRVLSTLPASRLGMGPDVSFSLVRDWTRWGRHRDYLHGPFGLRPQADRYRGRVLALSFSDDVGLGCRRAVEVLHRDFSQARLEHHHVRPGHVGAPRIGHFGYFRGAAAPPLWARTAAWLDGGTFGPAATSRRSGSC